MLTIAKELFEANNNLADAPIPAGGSVLDTNTKQPEDTGTNSLCLPSVMLRLWKEVRSLTKVLARLVTDAESKPLLLNSLLSARKLSTSADFCATFSSTTRRSFQNVAFENPPKLDCACADMM